MLSLPAALEAEQKKLAHQPYVQLRFSRHLGGRPRLLWERIYSSTLSDARHACALSGEGTLLRAKEDGAGTGVTLNRSESPSPSSDFDDYGITLIGSGKQAGTTFAVCAEAGSGGECAFLFVPSASPTTRVRVRTSADDGETWASAINAASSLSGTPTHVAAAYRDDGDILCLFSIGATLYALRRTAGTWGSTASSSLSFGSITGLAVQHDGLDWRAVVTGTDGAGDAHAWTTMYGDGSQVALNAWQALRSIISSPAGSGVTYSGPAIWDESRVAFCEAYSGTQAYTRALMTVLRLGAPWGDDAFSEPQPHEHDGAFGPAATSDASWHWLSNPDGVWRAPAEQLPVDAVSSIQRLRVEVRPEGATLEAVVDDSNGATGAAEEIAPGAEVLLRLGYYVPGSGAQWIQNGVFYVQEARRVRSQGRAVVVVKAADGWSLLERWRPRRSVQWTKDGGTSLSGIASWIVQRAGAALSTSGASSVWTGLQPGFALHPRLDTGRAVRRLLALAPDGAYWQNGALRVRELSSSESTAYDYGPGAHPLRALTLVDLQGANRFQVVGDAVAGERFDWEAVYAQGEAVALEYDLNRDAASEADDLAAAMQRKAEIAARADVLVAAVNCGLELYDVVTVTDAALGLDEEKRRVTAFRIDYQPARALYEQVIELGNP
jgi:hypothetical protein